MYGKLCVFARPDTVAPVASESVSGEESQAGITNSGIIFIFKGFTPSTWRGK